MRSAILFICFTFFYSCNNKEQVKTITKEVIVKKECNHQKDSTNKKFDCYDGSQLEMNICSANELAYYDSILNLKYKKLIKQLDSNIKEEADFQEYFSENLKKELVKSQRLWIESKESNREVIEQQYSGGSIRPLMKNSQTILDTKERIKFIEELLSDEI